MLHGGLQNNLGNPVMRIGEEIEVRKDSIGRAVSFH
jgi:hypothetical protein